MCMKKHHSFKKFFHKKDPKDILFQEFLAKSAKSEYFQLYTNLSIYPIDDKIKGLQTLLLPSLPKEDTQNIQELLGKIFFQEFLAKSAKSSNYQKYLKLSSKPITTIVATFKIILEYSRNL